MRPFELRSTPIVGLEAKLGKIIAEKDYTRPTKLKHWRMVYRKRKGDNFQRIDKLHEIIGDKPKRIPINLVSDDRHENFSLFRGAFDQSKLMCGAPVRAEDAWDMMKHPVHDGAPVHAPTKEEDGQEVVTLKDGETVPVTRDSFIRAQRFFDSNGTVEEPYDFPCSKHCKIWQNGKCDIEGTLYFYLAGEHIPDDLKNILGVFRASGTWAQRTLLSSLKHISELTNGILANLPLVLCHHMTQKRTSDDEIYTVPVPKIYLGLPKDQFAAKLEQEIKRRRRLYEMLHSEPPTCREDLLQTGSLRDMQGREELQTMMPVDDEELASDERPDYPDHLVEHFDQKNVPPRKREMLWEQHEGDVEAIKEQVDEDVSAQPDAIDGELEIDDDDLFED